MIKVVVNEYPREPKDCPFAAQENFRSHYFCKLGNYRQNKCDPRTCTKLVTFKRLLQPENDTDKKDNCDIFDALNLWEEGDETWPAHRSSIP